MIDLLKTITDHQEKEFDEAFKNVATGLFNNYAVQTPGGLFRLLELEFYWVNKLHEDKTVYKRHHIMPETGQWFHHYSGVDIALLNRGSHPINKNEDPADLSDNVLKNGGGYGGILIRKIQHLDPDGGIGKIYDGPMVCAMRLFSGHSAFEEANNNNATCLVKPKNPYPESKIGHKPRIGMGDNSKHGSFDSREYNFFVVSK